MTSSRELIVRNIVDSLNNQQLVRLGTVSRDPGLDILELANTAFPAVIVNSGDEVRLSITQGGPAQLRESTMAVVIQVWTNTRAPSADSLRNELIAGIEQLLDQDPSRGGTALDTQLVLAEVGSDTPPYNSMTLTFEVKYTYIKGNP
jgi:hypothetical protein